MHSTIHCKRGGTEQFSSLVKESSKRLILLVTDLTSSKQQNLPNLEQKYLKLQQETSLELKNVSDPQWLQL